ncbi:CHAT domain-containing protein [Microtetraspora glauca]|uniref:CHAT domain-containing protein n=1 Tax=Microtetraspora glauca TaxID=1996 RepID=A0ABV3GI92_MICGL
MLIYEQPSPTPREQWFDALFAQVLTLAGDSAHVMRAFRPVSSRPNLGAASLVAWICLQAGKAKMTGQIVQDLMASGTLINIDRSAATAAVRAIRVNFAQRGLPIPDWWDAGQLLEASLHHLLPRIQNEHGRAAASEHLRIFGFQSESIIDSFLMTPLEPPPVPELPSFCGTNVQSAVDLLASIASQTDFIEKVRDTCARSMIGEAGVTLNHWASYEETSGNWLIGEQFALQGWRLLQRVIASALEERGPMAASTPSHGDRAIRLLKEAAVVADQALDRYRTWASSLSLVELNFIQPQDEANIRRRRWLDTHLKVRNAGLLLPDSVPDTEETEASALIPAWVENMVFNKGGRSMHSTIGPLNLWGAVIEIDADEKALLPTLRGIRRVRIHEEGSSVVFQVAIGAPESDDIAWAQFFFNPDTLEGAIQLLMLSYSGARLDWYRLHDERRISHLAAEFLEFPSALLDEMLARVDETFAQAETANPDKSMMAQLFQELEPANGDWMMFEISDWAKSEDILFELGLVLSPPTIGHEEHLDLISARIALADAELAKVSATLSGEVAPTILEHAGEAQSRYGVVRQNTVARDHIRSVTDLTAGIIGEGRVFVQFSESDEWLAAIVAFDLGDGVNVRFVDLGRVPVKRLQYESDRWVSLCARSWIESADILDELLYWVGNNIVDPLVDTLSEVEARHVIFCPSRSLEPIPLHAAPLGEGAFCDRFNVSYAPSAAITSRLALAPSIVRHLDLVVESNGASSPSELGLNILNGPMQEAEALRSLAAHVSVLTGAYAEPTAVLAAISRSRVVHIAAHAWASADRSASGLWLAGARPPDALLSAAMVYAGPPLSETALVVLSACETAHHPLVGRAVQAWRGLDGTFLSRGVRAVVASLWNVEDLAALIYGTVFHVLLWENASIAEAHKAATRALRGFPVNQKAMDLLDRVRPSWRTEMVERGLNRAYRWSTYRPSGVCW